MTDVSRVIRRTLRAHGIKGFRRGGRVVGYADGGTPDDLPDVGEPAIPDAPLSQGTKFGNRLFGTGGEERYQTWPERLVRSGVTAAGDALAGDLPGWEMDPETGEFHTSREMMSRAQDMAGLAGGQTLLTGAARSAPRAAVAAADSQAVGAPLAALEHAPTFYSHLEKTVEAAPIQKGTGEQWLGTLTNKGVKKEELEHTGTQAFLEQNADRPLTKAEVAEHVGANKVQLGEVRKGDPFEPPEIAAKRDEFQKLNDRADDVEKGGAELTQQEYDRMHQLSGELMEHPNPWLDKNVDTKYESYQLPGGENYREKLLTMPTANDKYIKFTDAMREKYGDKPLGQMPMTPGERAYIDKQIEAYGDNGGSYKTSHWDEPNILVHRRTNDREMSLPFTPEETAASEARKAAQPQIDALRQQQADVFKEMNSTVKPLESARQAQIMEDFKAGKMPFGDAQRAMEQVVDFPEIAPHQAKLQQLRAQEDQLRAGLPPEPKPQTTKALHIEEIQSDWHQAGRKRGYSDPEARAANEAQAKEAHENLEKALADKDVDYRAIGNIKTQLKTAADNQNHADIKMLSEQAGRLYGDDVGQLAANFANKMVERRRLQSDIPDAPFKKNWHELALKDAIREAAEKGHDRISWTPGEAQAARYDLSKQIDYLAYNPATGHLQAYKDRRLVIDKPNVSKEQLADTIGKEAAEKVLNAPTAKVKDAYAPSSDYHTLENADLKVGGEGMKGFYDKIIPDAMNKIGKPHGVKVQQGLIRHEGSRAEFDRAMHSGDSEAIAKASGMKTSPVQYMDIPQSLKDQALKKGFSLFEDSSVGAPLAALENTQKTYWSDLAKTKHPIPVEDMTATRVPTGELQPHKTITPEDLQGSVLTPAVGDRTAAGARLTHINEQPLSAPVSLEGGPDFMRAAAQAKDKAVWAGDKPPISAMARRAREGSEGGKDVKLVYSAMGARSGDYSHMMTDALLGQLPGAKISRKAIAEFDAAMKKQNPAWPGLKSRALRDTLLTSGNMRKEFVQELALKTHQDKGFPEIGSTRAAITEPKLIGQPTGASGYAISKLDPSGRVIAKPAVPHTTYRAQVGGDYVGGLENSIPRDLMFPDFYKGRRAAGLPRLADDRAFGMSDVYQPANQEWLDRIMKHLGKKDGGRVGYADGGAPEEDAAPAPDFGPFANLVPQAKAAKPDFGPFAHLVPQGPMSASDVISGAISNAPASAMQFGSDIVRPIMHPIETATSLKDLGLGLLEKSGLIGTVFPSAGGGHEKYADAMGEYLKNRYGSVEAAKQSFAKDPVGVLSDASMILTGGETALGRLPGVVGRTGEVMGSVGRAVDPLMAPVNAAKLGTKAVGELATHTGAGALDTAYRTGVEGGDAGQVFRENMRGDVSPAAVVETARQGVSNIAKDRSESYVRDMDAIGKRPEIMDWDKVTAALQKNATVKNFKGIDISPETAAIRNKISDAIEKWGELPPDIYHTAAGFDALKQMIGEMAQAQPYGTPGRHVADQAYNAIRAEIIKQVPEYGKAMKNYETASNLIKEMNQTLSLNPRGNIDTALRKLQSILRNNVNTNYGRRMELGNILEENGATHLMAALSGQSLNSWAPRGLGKFVAGSTLPAIGAGLASGNILPAVGAAATLPFMSPRLMGEVSHFAGRTAGRFLDRTNRALGNVGLGNRAAGNLVYRTGRAANPEENVYPLGGQ